MTADRPADAVDTATVVIALIVALLASGLTLFSGFGLGTLLLPAFALIFPLEVAVGATAVVHLANNLWKGALLWRDAHWPTVLRFGVPAALAAFLGAFILVRLPHSVWASYTLAGRSHEVTPVGVLIGGLIVLFGLFDLVPRLKRWHVSRKHLPWGGLLSGFFGGLSGHQGALRSVFLTKVGLGPTGFVATGTFAAIMVDVARLTVYGFGTWQENATGIAESGGWGVVFGAIAMAFLGAFIGKRMLGKVTMDGVRTLVGILLLLIGASLAAGLV